MNLPENERAPSGCGMTSPETCISSTTSATNFRSSCSAQLRSESSHDSEGNSATVATNSIFSAEAQNDESRRLPKEAAALRSACARSISEINAWSTAVRDVPCADQPSYAQPVSYTHLRAHETGSTPSVNFALIARASATKAAASFWRRRPSSFYGARKEGISLNPSITKSLPLPKPPQHAIDGHRSA